MRILVEIPRTNGREMQAPAAIFIIDQFGSIRKTADALNKPTTTVQGWFDRESVPVLHWQEIIEALALIGVQFTIEDFLGTHPVSEKRAAELCEKRRKKEAA